MNICLVFCQFSSVAYTIEAVFITHEEKLRMNIIINFRQDKD